MRRDWDRRARENAFHYVDTGQDRWSEEEIFQSGRRIVEQHVLNDMENVCRGKPPDRMRALDIGCGIGRVTKALAQTFQEAHGVDVSGEMVARARSYLARTPNAHVHRNSGADLQVVGELKFDFVFSFVVFQHIPSLAVIESYIREAGRVLKPGGLFKVQVQGRPAARWYHRNSWFGASIGSEEEARRLAERCGLEARYFHGAGTQYFWLWLFKPENGGRLPRTSPQEP